MCRTRTGPRGWQAARGYPSTGYLSMLQHEALLAENVPAGTVAKKSSKDDDEDDDKPTRRANRGSAGSSGGGASSGGGGAGAIDECVGGVIRGTIGKKWL